MDPCRAHLSRFHGLCLCCWHHRRLAHTAPPPSAHHNLSLSLPLPTSPLHPMSLVCPARLHAQLLTVERNPTWSLLTKPLSPPQSPKTCVLQNTCGACQESGYMVDDRGGVCGEGSGGGGAGPGAFDFTQGDLNGTTFWRLVRDFLHVPSEQQKACQAPKPILLDTGVPHLS